MANSLSNTKLSIPKGFQSLLVGLSTEILRHQPKNIHAFAADYFEKLLQQRERGQTNLEDQYYTNQTFQNEYLINGPNVDNAATIIQAQYRGHKTRKDLEKIQQEKLLFDDNEEKERAAIAIQAQFRGFQVRKNLQEEQQNLDQPSTTSHDYDKQLTAHDEIETGDHNDINQLDFQSELTQLSEDFERHTQIPRSLSFDCEQEGNLFFEEDDDDMSDSNLDKAATRIQASYRGYKTRKELGTNVISTHSNPGHDQHHSQIPNKNILSPSAEGNKVPANENDDNAAAAVKIQAAYRGYRVRKDLEK